MNFLYTIAFHNKRWMLFILMMVALLLTPQIADARSRGIVEKSGLQGDTCTSCHIGGVEPTVMIDGPTTVVAGETNMYTFTLMGGPAVDAGFNVAVSDFLGALSPSDGDSQLLENELTHAAKKSFTDNEASFSYEWTAPAEAQSDPVIMYGAGNSVDGTGNTQGDGVGVTTLAIDVVAAVETVQTVNCDGTWNLVDSILIKRLDAFLISSASDCNGLDTAISMNESECDVNNDEKCGLLDAVIIQQCNAFLTNMYCEALQ